MNALTTATKTMSSRDIAELTNKEHKNVLRVIRELVDGQILDAQNEPLKFEYRGQQFDYYELNKRDSMVVVARLSPEFMAAVVDRWQELEAQIVHPVIALPQNYIEAEGMIEWDKVPKWAHCDVRIINRLIQKTDFTGIYEKV